MIAEYSNMEDTVTPEQIALVQETFELVAPISDTAAALFYGRLFQLDPSLRSMFKGDMSAQGKKLMSTLALVVRGLSAPERIVPAVQNLGARHAGYGVRDEHYATVGAALLWTLAQGLGDRFTEAAAAAWAAAFALLASLMQEAARTPLRLAA
jgi:hemoglobin-like flavoprotein